MENPHNILQWCIRDFETGKTFFTDIATINRSADNKRSSIREEIGKYLKSDEVARRDVDAKMVVGRVRHVWQRRKRL